MGESTDKIAVVTAGAKGIGQGICDAAFASEGARVEYDEDGIRVLAVNPGAIDTPLVQEALDAVGGDQEEARRGLAAIHPVVRMGQPADIANALLFLASDWAFFMTGEAVCVDSGIMAKGAWA